MGKTYKKAISVLCSATLILSVMSSGISHLVNADDSSVNTENKMQFGKTDTYLQLSNPLTSAPAAAEATVNVTPKNSEWTLFDAKDTKVIGINGSTSTGTTASGELPGEGKSYIQFDSGTTEVHTNNANLNIFQPYYEKEDLALSFWCYNGSESAEKLSDGGCQIRLSSYSADKDKNMIYYVANNISLKSGWNYVKIPLSEFGVPPTTNTEAYGVFDVHKIQSFGFNGYKNENGTVRRFADFKIVALNTADEETTEWDLGTEIGSSVTETIDVPDEQLSYFKVSSNEKVDVLLNSNLGINTGKYGMDQLALSFWCYNGSDTAEKLGNNNEQLRISSNLDNVSSNALYYPMADITLNPGWNHIQLKLSDWPQWIMGDFSVSNIQSFGIDCRSYTNSDTSVRYFSNFKLIAITEWELGKLTEGTSTKYSELPEGAPAGNYSYYKVENGATVSRPSKILNIKQTTYSKEELAVSFWYYNSVENKTNLTGTQLRISSEANVSYNKFIYYPMVDISITKGWNYIELPLSKFGVPSTEYSKEPFDVNNIQFFGIDSDYTADSDFYFTDFTLKVITPTKAVVGDIESGNDNYSIISNINSDDTNKFAFFVTSKGYPAVIIGDKQVTLTKNIADGTDVKISVIRDSDGYVSFYLDDKLAAKTSETVDAAGIPSSAYCVGADGSGKQIMNGTISDLKVYSDSGKTTCIGSWSLNEDIKHVTSPVADESGNNNSLVFRGSRANDWVDYTVPSDIGNDYWSLVFVPDIQNLTIDGEYTETWNTMAQWIADNASKENIKHVIGAGDSTWNNNDEQYNRALNGFKLFSDNISWSNMVGNHDYDWSKTVRDSSMYEKYFGEETIKATAAKSTYQGYYNDPDGLSTTENSYYRFTVNGVKWMIVQLEYHPRTGAINWANDIIKAHPLDNVILTTHGYINGWGQYIGETMNYIQSNENGYIDSTNKIWPLLKSNDNIKMILNGHSVNGSGAIVEKTETTDGGNTVPVFMINAQDTDAGEGYKNGDAYYNDKPLGMLSIFRFSKDGSKVAIQYYSPSEGKSFSPADPWGLRNSNSIEKSLTAEKSNNIVKSYSNVTAGTAPTTDLPEGYVFAGWFTDEECKTALAAGSTADNAYAKFVDAEVLSVKAQLAVNEGDTVASIRFVTTVESLDLQKVGFEISDGSKTADINKTSGTSVYETLKAVDNNGLGTTTLTYKPNEEFSPVSAYFKAFTITNIKEARFDTKFTAKAFWVTLDGTTVYGSEITRCVNDGLKKNS